MSIIPRICPKMALKTGLFSHLGGVFGCFWTVLSHDAFHKYHKREGIWKEGILFSSILEFPYFPKISQKGGFPERKAKQIGMENLTKLHIQEYIQESMSIGRLFIECYDMERGEIVSLRASQSLSGLLRTPFNSTYRT